MACDGLGRLHKYFHCQRNRHFFSQKGLNTHKKHERRREASLFTGEFECTEMLRLCNKTHCCYDPKSNKYNISSKGLCRRTLEDCGDGPKLKNLKVMNETVNVTSTNRGYRTVQHDAATHEQTTKRLPYFTPQELQKMIECIQNP